MHFAYPPVINIENSCVPLAGAAVVNDDVFPASALNFRVVDGFTQGRGKVAPSFHEDAKKGSVGRFVI